jgi:catechol 2,3-dioxygenase-like lactoylglutathione lyase family enzyme
VDDVRAMRERLRANNVRFFNDLHDGPYGLTIYVADPDGLKIELYEVGQSA